MTPVEIMLSGAVTAMASVIVYLFRDYQARFQALELKLDRAESEIRECEKDRERLWEEILKLDRGAVYSADPSQPPVKRSPGLQRAAERQADTEHDR